MNGFTVDPAELRDSAGHLVRLGEDLGEHHATRWFMAPEEVGHHGLANELRDFQNHLTAAIATFQRDVEAASEQLRASADAYEELDFRSASELR